MRLPAGPGAWDSDPEIDLDPDSDHLILRGDLVWRQDSGVTLVAPSGMRWDGASVPRVLWPRLGHPLGVLVRRASAIHDYECLHRVGSSWDAHNRLYHTLRASGMSWWTAQLYRIGVMIGGPRW